VTDEPIPSSLPLPTPLQNKVDAHIGTGIDADALDATRMLRALSPTAHAALTMLEVVASIDSTNSELLRRDTAHNGASVLFAEQQTGGRGRQGRVWVSPPACNLYVSVAHHFGCGIARLSGLSLVVGVAVAEALQSLGLDSIALKWPNDMVIADGAQLRKLGGVLIESGGIRGSGVSIESGAGGAIRAVVGLGLNVRMANADDNAGASAAIDQPWTDVRSQLGARTPSRNAIAAATLERLLPAFAVFERDGLAPFLQRYADFDALRGLMLETRGGAEPLVGIADGIADDGALRLRTARGDVLLRAGEVSVRPA
jgi:BirA family transcriptional regulator, biotin operon repressor / biotin---[acetyl-CoA-carboxylase] ligase